MGVEYRAVVVVGVPWQDVPEDVRDRLEEDYEEFSLISPWFDAARADCLVGIIIDETGDYDYSQLDLDRSKVAKALKSVKEQLGVDGKLYLSPYGW